MNMRKKRIQSFTMIEVMIVLVIIGIVSAFAIPNYTKMVKRDLNNRARQDMLLIYDAAQQFLLRTGVAKFPFVRGSVACPLPGVGGCTMDDLSMINSILNIGLVSSETTYVCYYWNISGDAFCTATWPANPVWPNCFQITIHTDQPLSGTNPSCAGNYCF